MVYKSSKKDYNIVLTRDSLDEMVGVLNKSNVIAFDIIATNKSPIEAKIVGFSFSIIKFHVNNFHFPVGSFVNFR